MIDKVLTNNGSLDKNAVHILGGSYGGYATLAGVTFTPDLYACAIDYVGVSNLFTFLNLHCFNCFKRDELYTWDK